MPSESVERIAAILWLRAGAVIPFENAAPSPRARYIERAESAALLIDGPVDGQVVENYRGGPVLMHSDDHAGMVARYRPTRDRHVLRFREWDRVIASIPGPA